MNIDTQYGGVCQYTEQKETFPRAEIHLKTMLQLHQMILNALTSHIEENWS